MKNHILLAILKYLVTSDFKVVEEKFIDEGIEKPLIDEYFKEFKKLRDQHRITDNQQKDINHWAKEGWEKFVEFIDKLKEEKSKTVEKKLQKMEGAELFAENKDWYVYRILTHEACMKYGANTKWCITQQGGSHFKTYSKDHNIYIYIAKSPFKDSIPDKYHKIAALTDGNGKAQYWDAEDDEFYLNHFDWNDTLPKEKLEAWENLILINGKKYKVNEIPPNSRIKGDLYIDRNSGLVSLPEGLIIEGDLTIKSNPTLTKIPAIEANSIDINLPKNATIDPNIKTNKLELDFADGADKIPLFTKVRDLEITSTYINIPENFHIEGDLILNIKATKGEDVRHHTSIPKNMKANSITVKKEYGSHKLNLFINNDVTTNRLKLSECIIENLPLLPNVGNVVLEKCKIGYYNVAPNTKVLDISHTKIEKLSAANLEDLIANYAVIKKIDPNLKVTNKIEMKGAKIPKLPDGLTLQILDASESNLKQLPKNLDVGTLNISDTPITTLDVPGLNIRDSLNMQYTDIEELPSKIENIPFARLWHGKNTFKRTKLKKLPASVMDGTIPSLDLSESMIEILPPKLEVGENLVLKDMPNLKKLPSTLIVGGILSIVRVPHIKKLPAKLKAKILITDSDVEIPKTAKIQHVQQARSR